MKPNDGGRHEWEKAHTELAKSLTDWIVTIPDDLLRSLRPGAAADPAAIRGELTAALVPALGRFSRSES